MGQTAKLRGIEPPIPEGEGLSALIPSGVVLTHRKRIVWANDRMAELAGVVSSDSLLGLLWADQFADSGGGFPDPLGPRAVECELIRAGGETRIVSCRPVDDPSSSQKPRCVDAAQERSSTPKVGPEPAASRIGSLSLMHVFRVCV